MLKTIGNLLLAWFSGIFGLVILAVSIPALIAISAQAVTDVEANSSEAARVGLVQAIQSFPLWCWFIIPIVVVGATVVYLRNRRKGEC